MNTASYWLLGVLGSVIVVMGAAWAVWIMGQIKDLGKKVDSLALDVAGYSKDVTVAGATESAKITAIVVRVEGSELKIKALENANLFEKKKA
jgi:hypothetical protein